MSAVSSRQIILVSLNNTFFPLDREHLAALLDYKVYPYRGIPPRVVLFFLPYLLGCALALRGGVAVGDATTFFVPVLFALLLELVSGYVYTEHYPWLKAGRILFLMLALGVLHGSGAKPSENGVLPPPKTLPAVVRLLTSPTFNPWGANVQAELLLVEDSAGVWQPYNLRGKLRFYAEDSLAVTLQQGDILRAQVNFRQYANRDSVTGFDYVAWQRSQGILFTARVRANTAQCLSHDPSATQPSVFQKLHAHVLEAYAAAGLSGQPLELVKAMSIGDRADLDRDIRQSFARAGVAHILALSGLHVGFVYAILAGLARIFLLTSFWRRLLRCVLPLLGVWLFVGVAGATPSLLRAAIMLSVWGISRLFYQRWHSLDVLAVAAFIILWLTPEALFSLSFQLSFSALLGIILFKRFFRRLIPEKPLLLHWGAELLVISLCAQLGTLPFTLYVFGSLPLLSLFTNLLAIPLASGIVPGALLLAFLPLGSPLAQGLGFLLEQAASLLIWSTERLAPLPLVSLSEVYIPLLGAWLMGLLLLAVGVWGLIKCVGEQWWR